MIKYIFPCLNTKYHFIVSFIIIWNLVTLKINIHDSTFFHRCPVYTALPPMCKMVAPPSGQCCGQVSCQVVTTIPTTPTTQSPHLHPGLCLDKLDNCQAYGKSSCVAPYVGWAKSNCPAFCGFCSKYTHSVKQLLPASAPRLV